MGVLRTDEWLQQSDYKPLEICESLKTYFPGASAKDIYNHLIAHGMYREVPIDAKELLRTLKKNKVWEIVQRQKNKLKKRWNGPDIPVFIFPSDTTNKKMLRKSGGKSGVAFHDKLFLFISDITSENELKALFTHEYNHVCRLDKLTKNESEFILLDTIILEGVAENAVHDIVGENFVAPWVHYYSNKKLKNIWKKLIYPKRNISRDNPAHQTILYGLKFYPEMVGYAVGYYLVERFITKEQLKDWEIISLSSEEIAQIV